MTKRNGAQPLVTALVPVIALVFGACSTDPADRGAQVTLRDSADVRIASFASLDELDAPEWDVDRDMTLRADDLGLYLVRDAVFLPDGGLLIANAGRAELVVVSAEGELVRRIGRRGEGPGEYESPIWLGLGEDSTVWVYDRALLRLTHLSRAFDVLETLPLSPADRITTLLPLTMHSDGTLLAIFGAHNQFRSSGEYRDTVPLLAIDPALATRDTLGSWLGRERAFTRIAAGALVVPIGFARSLQAAGSHGRVVIGSTGEIDIMALGPDERPYLILRAAGSNRSVGEDAARAFRDVIEGPGFAAHGIPGAAEAYRAARVHETFPAFGALGIDPVGRIWVGTYPPPGADEREWVVFSREGAVLGRLRLPFEFDESADPRSEVLDIGSDRIVLRLRDELDVERLEIWSFEETRWQ